MDSRFDNTSGNRALLRKLDVFAVTASVLVLILVVLMRQVSIDVSYDFSILPGFHALLNSFVAISLIVGLLFIKKGNMAMHKRFMLIAMSLSVVFLLSYVVYHITSESTPFCKEGGIRYVYFILLISHIVLAAISLPFILFTFNRSWAGFYGMHRKLAKWVFPFWLYVAITGPVCYLMLYPCY